MKNENDPLYKALYLIDVNFSWRWINHAFFIDEIQKNKSYSENFNLAYNIKKELTRRIT